MKLSLLVRLLLVVAGLSAGSVAPAAENLNAVRARMEQRLGSLNELKDRGAAGENNRGYLEARGAAQAADQKVIADENADRRTVYADIAARTGANPDTVGRQRAQQLASLARRGHWIQDASGAWKQKG
ncbi:MAG: YdbL family protein [Opitutaceae bacterium]|nr:YdbL family protein [Opitutaceae bacterium]